MTKKCVQVNFLFPPIKKVYSGEAFRFAHGGTILHLQQRTHTVQYVNTADTITYCRLHLVDSNNQLERFIFPHLSNQLDFQFHRLCFQYSLYAHDAQFIVSHSPWKRWGVGRKITFPCHIYRTHNTKFLHDIFYCREYHRRLQTILVVKLLFRHGYFDNNIEWRNWEHEIAALLLSYYCCCCHDKFDDDVKGANQLENV